MARPSRPPPPPKRKRRVLTASAARVRPKAPEFQRVQKPWQARIWDYYDGIGEVKEASHFYGRLLSKIEVYAAVLSDDGESILRVTDETVVAALERIQDGTGSRSKIQARYGVLRFTVGECWLTCTFRDGGEEWEVLSLSELEVRDGKYVRHRGDGFDEETYEEPPTGADPSDGQMAAWRLWKSHPHRSGDADSPMRGVLEICEQILILTRAVRAQARSRLRTAGLLILPDEITLLSQQPVPLDPTTGEEVPQGDADEDLEEDPFSETFQRAMIEPIEDETAASAVVPLLARAPGEWLDKVRYVTFNDGNYPEGEQIRQALQRLELGLDMPVGVLSGVGSMNHWSAWAVSREAWQDHGQPVTEEFCGDLTAAYLVPALANWLPEGGTVEVKGSDGNPTTVIIDGPSDVFVWYDESKVVLNPDRAKDTKDAWDRLLVSDAASRRELGYDPTDAPDPEEWQRRADFLKGGAPGTPATGADPSAVVPGAPATGPDSAQARLQGLVELAVARALEVAGSRFRTRLQSNPKEAARFKTTPNRHLVATAGPDLVHDLCGQDCESSLVEGAADALLEPHFNGGAPLVNALVSAVATSYLYSSESPQLSPGAMALLAEQASGT